MAALQNARFIANPTLQEMSNGQGLIKKGSKGEHVRLIQEALCDLGFNLQSYSTGGKLRGGADGSFGPQTAAAIRNFQAHASRFHLGISVDGVFGPKSLAALDALAPDVGKAASDPLQACERPTPHWEGQAVRVVVVISEHRTFLFDEAGTNEAVYPNATGKGKNRTDPGLKKVDALLGEAAARATGERLWGNAAVFGLRIVGLSWADGSHSGEELHGTSRPDQMGMYVSHGCVRHYNEHIVPLFDRLSVGDLVAVVQHIDDPRLRLNTDVS